eukprot:COSAG01_NODE_46829_length_396_cov_1.053872_1_plen_32_part_01
MRRVRERTHARAAIRAREEVRLLSESDYVDEL